MRAVTILDSLEAAEKAATAGPWEIADRDTDGPWGAAGNIVLGPAFANPSLPGIAKPWVASTGMVAVKRTMADAALIALLRNHAADLLAVAKAAQEWQRIFDADRKTDVEWANGMQRLRHALVPLTTGGSE